MSFINLFRVSKRYLNIPKYHGPFDLKKPEVKYYIPPESEINEEFEEIRAIRQMQIKEPSPFHLVWRHKSMSQRPWQEKVILRRLGLHDKNNFEYTIIPNTPHFNKMLWEVKHLICLKPVSFPDGVPQEKDIGAIKMNVVTGAMNINESCRISESRLANAGSPPIFQGRYLREYLKYVSGLFGTTIQTCDGLVKFDGCVKGGTYD